MLKTLSLIPVPYGPWASPGQRYCDTEQQTFSSLQPDQVSPWVVLDSAPLPHQVLLWAIPSLKRKKKKNTEKEVGENIPSNFMNWCFLSLYNNCCNWYSLCTNLHWTRCWSRNILSTNSFNHCSHTLNTGSLTISPILMLRKLRLTFNKFPLNRIMNINHYPYWILTRPLDCYSHITYMRLLYDRTWEGLSLELFCSQWSNIVTTMQE